MILKNPILILLAGGKSSRMGTPKGLLPYKNTYWILEQINRFKVHENALIYIGLGFDSQLYFDAIPWLKKAIKTPYKVYGKNVQVILNTSPELGKFSTLQSVLKQINTQHDVLILPIDVPLLNNFWLHKIIASKNAVVIPNYKEKNGHPVKLSHAIWKPFLELNLLDAESRLDVQIKKIKASEITNIQVDDEAVLKNLNTPEGWEAFKKEQL